MAEVLSPTGGPRLDAAWLALFDEFVRQENTLTGKDSYGEQFGFVLLPTPRRATPAVSLQDRAAEQALNNPMVVVEPPALPELTGDLLSDVRAVTGLTYDEIARAAGVRGRTVANWRAEQPPESREGFLQALRSIGMSLVGGLGADGVRRWLLAGAPTRIDRIAGGGIEAVVAEARAYDTSPAT